MLKTSRMSPADQPPGLEQPLEDSQWKRQWDHQGDHQGEQQREQSGEGPVPACTGDDILVLGSSDGTLSPLLVSQVLLSISRNPAFEALVLERIADDGQVFSSYAELFNYLKFLLCGGIRDGAESWGFDPFKLIEALANCRERVAETLDAYDAKTKQNPKAVHWPNPERDAESSVFKTLPYAERLGLITKETPIGSAGSCFAIEISRSLQERGFNYVTTECEHEDALNGVFTDNYDPNRKLMSFTASYGLLFNTPSFRQLAEKAFGVRCVPRILMPMEMMTPTGRRVSGVRDPFRENVYYYSFEHYEANYEKHIAAVREAFLTCEYFVVTPGLNECWEFIPDGSVLSRNPHRLDFYPLLRRRVLSVEENVQNLQRMIDIVRAHNPNFKVIISLSPVPFLATTRADQHHVVTANTHSKAVLRVAAEELVKANRDVFYFPSYELVTVCSEHPWEIDQRHVNRTTVERIMELFEIMFVA